ncbi:hypothetical protein [Niallia sp. 01092]|uniref:hypothetical protein n=1 Tax=unclassified Niallia TaxID=2837522 RepID=UPI003FD4152C
MQEERLDRIENVLTQLVKMVGNTNQKLHVIEMKIDNKLEEMENKNEERHGQILEKLT